MYAKVQVRREIPPPGHGQEEAKHLLDVVSAHPGFAGAWVLRPLGGPHGALVTLWDTREDAEAAPARSAPHLPGPRPAMLHDGLYDVALSYSGPAAGEEARYVQLIWFDGPRGPELVQAAARAGRERIMPAVRDLAGLVSVHSMEGPDGSAVTLIATTSVEVLERGAEVIMTTELLPGEDQALLLGPDRVDVCSVIAAASPVLSR